MISSSVEDSTEDEDGNITEISHKMELLQVGKERDKKMFYYPTKDSFEFAQRFNRKISLDGSDLFIKKLRLALKKFPSISVESTKKVKQSDKNIQNQEFLPRKKPSDGFEKESRLGSTNNIPLKNKFQPWNVSSVFPIPSKNEFYKDEVSNEDNEYSMTHHVKSQSVDLIKNLSNSDDVSFRTLFIHHKQEFLELLPQMHVVQEVIPQVIKVALKIFKIEHSSKRNIILSLTHVEFIDKIVSYITLLPTDSEEIVSDTEIEVLFNNILLFCEHMNKEMPTKSAGIVRKVLLSLQYAARGLKEVKNFHLNETLKERVSKLLMNSSLQKQNDSRKSKIGTDENMLNPPDNIKDIGIYPTKQDLFEPVAFLRKNVVDGSYRDVNHYIDVQFRLLREDFIAPLRNGLQLYCESIAKGHLNQNQRFDNIRVHMGVKILHGTITNGRLGHLVQLHKDASFHVDSKRFIFGSLVLFTADEFESFFCGTVISPAGENLLIVELCNDHISLNDMYGSVFTMIESEVYFGPYLHVLTALQNVDCENFPMQEYIVDVVSNDKQPKTTAHHPCPSTLNESQKKAFVSAMDNEFVVIQGPPGTGKTFLAEAITKTLLLNKGPIIESLKQLINNSDGIDDDERERERERFWQLKKRIRSRKSQPCVYPLYPREWKLFHSFFSEEEREDKPILVICYTNHALDQFLARLITCTKRVIRVGGQSKNPVVQKFNLNDIRRCWIKEQTFNLRRCNCSLCRYLVKEYNSYFKHIEYSQFNTYQYLLNLKILEASACDGVLKVSCLLPWMSPGLRKPLSSQEYYEAWLLEGANVHIEEDINNDNEPDFIIYTQQLLSEFRESNTYNDELEVYDIRVVERNSTDRADGNFFVKVSGLARESEVIQKKLRQCRQKGGKDNTSKIYEDKIEDLEKQRRYISYMLAHRQPVNLKRIRELNSSTNIWTINFEERWMLYNYWMEQYENLIKMRLISIESTLRAEEKVFAEKRDKFDLQLLKSANVIGMTTTGSARLKDMLEKIGPEIVVVEEAAEVLEAHVVVGLNPKVKKVILIGDHKQLRPNPAVYALAQKYKLDISLFERMINNGLACQVLDTQQRMRPEIASLIVPCIYPDLKNGERVLGRPDVRGVASNLFFVTHKNFEDESFGETRSHSNKHEVNFIISFCKYLLKQNYESSEITILTTYLGQKTALENERRRKNLSLDIRIATVDNYQGEESDIILLSLVRSNAEARIGFLSKENRVCVALSRAKNGLFIFGNMDNMTQSSSVWRQVKAQLEAMNSIGPALPLGCKRHPNEKSLVSCSEDLMKVPTSGCKLKCGAELRCGHICPEFCHSFDFEHEEEFACSLPCERKTCEEHKCQRTCGDECGNCRIVVEKQLHCGHSAFMQCCENSEFYRCQVKITLTLRACHHTITRFCYQDNVFCNEPCSGTMDCGHPCVRRCHTRFTQKDKHYVIDHIERDNPHKKMNCEVKIERSLECGHICDIPCKYSEKKITCKEPCQKTLNCGHNCDKLCGEQCCESCSVLVEKTLSPCGHQLMMPCSVAGTSSQCRQPCHLNLICGHPCPGTCSVDCSSFSCQEKVRSNVEPACGHGPITIPCHLNGTDLQANSDQLLQHCRAPCRADLPCGHLCVGRCGPCLQGRLHIPCSYPCARKLNCGHSCDMGCSSECPTICDHRCMYRCPHQACAQLCGDPCTPCQKICERQCRHQECSRTCSEDCDCPPCNEPCDVTLGCGHPCPGFCGEPCPKYCVVCHPDAFVTPDHKSEAGDYRYVSLEDCGHPIEEHLLRKLIIADGKPSEVIKCPVCGEQITFVLRFKDHIKKFYSNLTKAKEEEQNKIEKFESRMKTEKYNLRYSHISTERYGDHAFFILEHLKKARLVYKTSMWLFTFFKELTKGDTYRLRQDPSWMAVVERRKLLLGALSLRLDSMSVSDYQEFVKEIFCLELITRNWPDRAHLLHPLRKYSLDELKALI